MGARVALLRAVNVGGRTLTMGEVREAMAAAGFADARTLLATGNVVFDSEDPPTALEARIERALDARLHFRTEVMVRSGEAWAAAVASNPMPEEAAREPSHFVLLALKAPVDPAAVEALAPAIPGPERLGGGGGELYAWYPEGIGRSKLTTAWIERRLGARMTGRNWNTVQKIAQAVA